MPGEFSTILQALLSDNSAYSLFNPGKHFNAAASAPAAKLNAAFALALAGDQTGVKYLESCVETQDDSFDWKSVSQFYLAGLSLIFKEIEDQQKQHPQLNQAISELADCLSQPKPESKIELQEKIWAVFFPEAVGILSQPKKAIHDLREKRRVTITRPNPNQIKHPDQQILFTSNALLTIPSDVNNIDKLDFSLSSIDQIARTINEPQQYWYDHPIPVDIPDNQNEILYGLYGLDQALETERHRGNLHNKLKCILSVSTTHDGLHAISKEFIERVLARNKPLKNIDLYIFTENDTQRLIKQVLAPAAKHFLGITNTEELLQVFGVDGKYGRHYSFLKAIAPLWQLSIDNNIQATFKIDLDQVFPQEELIKETNCSALEHFQTRLWGSSGIDNNDQHVYLGMIAGALVNQVDIQQSLFTADVKLPESNPEFDQCIFYSKLPQAVSTEAEMMFRRDKKQTRQTDDCIQRIHVTGGTNGILIDALRKYRCFTPSFIARAEDQAYIMSSLENENDQLTYLHAEGLIMRHDKESFAQDILKSNSTGKLIGDYLRILYFSKYASCFKIEFADIKQKLAPFTGCFISSIPIAAIYLRFCLQAAAYFEHKDGSDGNEFVVTGAKRLLRAINEIRQKSNPVKKQFDLEHQGWNLYYDTLDAWQAGLHKKDPFATKLKTETQKIIDDCRVRTN